MKHAPAFTLLALACAACSSTTKPEAASPQTTSAALTSEGGAATKEDKSTAAEKWAEAKVAEERAKSVGRREAGDPLAMNNEVDNASIPTIERTPAKQLRAKSRADLDAAIALVANESSVDGAAKKIITRIGKPTWVENGRKRIWVAPAGARCHRLVLDADGTAEVETASKSDWRMLAATAKQNPCTGEIKRGL